MTNYQIADMVDELEDYDFYGVMMELAKMHDLETEDEFTQWLNDVLHEIKESMEED